MSSIRRLKEERIPYEDVVFKRKESMMCKIRGHKPPGCIVQIKVLKEHIKVSNGFTLRRKKSLFIILYSFSAPTRQSSCQNAVRVSS